MIDQRKRNISLVKGNLKVYDDISNRLIAFKATFFNAVNNDYDRLKSFLTAKINKLHDVNVSGAAILNQQNTQVKNIARGILLDVTNDRKKNIVININSFNEELKNLKLYLSNEENKNIAVKKYVNQMNVSATPQDNKLRLEFSYFFETTVNEVINITNEYNYKKILHQLGSYSNAVKKLLYAIHVHMKQNHDNNTIKYEHQIEIALTSYLNDYNKILNTKLDQNNNEDVSMFQRIVVNAIRKLISSFEAKKTFQKQDIFLNSVKNTPEYEKAKASLNILAKQEHI